MNDMDVMYLGKLVDGRDALMWQDDRTCKYVVCSHFDPTRPKGQQWDWGHYFMDFNDFVEYINESNKEYEARKEAA